MALSKCENAAFCAKQPKIELLNAKNSLSIIANVFAHVLKKNVQYDKIDVGGCTRCAAV